MVQRRYKGERTLSPAPGQLTPPSTWPQMSMAGMEERNSVVGGAADDLADVLVDDSEDALVDGLADGLSDDLVVGLADDLVDDLADGLADKLAADVADVLADGLGEDSADDLGDGLADVLSVVEASLFWQPKSASCKLHQR
jgi:hypothetical protein